MEGVSNQEGSGYNRVCCYDYHFVSRCLNCDCGITKSFETIMLTFRPSCVDSSSTTVLFCEIGCDLRALIEKAPNLKVQKFKSVREYMELVGYLQLHIDGQEELKPFLDLSYVPRAIGLPVSDFVDNIDFMFLETPTHMPMNQSVATEQLIVGPAVQTENLLAVEFTPHTQVPYIPGKLFEGGVAKLPNSRLIVFSKNDFIGDLNNDSIHEIYMKFRQSHPDVPLYYDIVQHSVQSGVIHAICYYRREVEFTQPLTTKQRTYKEMGVEYKKPPILKLSNLTYHIFEWLYTKVRAYRTWHDFTCTSMFDLPTPGMFRAFFFGVQDKVTNFIDNVRSLVEGDDYNEMITLGAWMLSWSLALHHGLIDIVTRQINKKEGNQRGPYWKKLFLDHKQTYFATNVINMCLEIVRDDYFLRHFASHILLGDDVIRMAIGLDAYEQYLTDYVRMKFPARFPEFLVVDTSNVICAPLSYYEIALVESCLGCDLPPNTIRANSQDAVMIKVEDYSDYLRSNQDKFLLHVFYNNSISYHQDIIGNYFMSDDLLCCILSYSTGTKFRLDNCLFKKTLMLHHYNKKVLDFMASKQFYHPAIVNCWHKLFIEEEHVDLYKAVLKTYHVPESKILEVCLDLGSTHDLRDDDGNCTLCKNNNFIITHEPFLHEALMEIHKREVQGYQDRLDEKYTTKVPYVGKSVEKSRKKYKNHGESRELDSSELNDLDDKKSVYVHSQTIESTFNELNKDVEMLRSGFKACFERALSTHVSNKELANSIVKREKDQGWGFNPDHSASFSWADASSEELEERGENNNNNNNNKQIKKADNSGSKQPIHDVRVTPAAKVVLSGVRKVCPPPSISEAKSQPPSRPRKKRNQFNFSMKHR
jgi:hypothetical protein